MMDENPILLWSIKCYKQKASDKSDPHTMFYLYNFNVHSLLLVLVWNSPLCHFSVSWIVHGLCENAVIEFFVSFWGVSGFLFVWGFILVFSFLLKDDIKSYFYSVLSHLTKGLQDSLYSQFSPVQPLLFSQA